MKKVLTLLMPLVFLLAACQKNNYVTPNRTIVTDIPRNSWRSYDHNRSFVVPVSVPEVDGFLVERGGVLVYISLDGGRTYEPVPQVYQGVSYGYSIRDGVLTLSYESADGATLLPPDWDARLKVVLLESDY